MSARHIAQRSLCALALIAPLVGLAGTGLTDAEITALAANPGGPLGDARAAIDAVGGDRDWLVRLPGIAALAALVAAAAAASTARERLLAAAVVATLAAPVLAARHIGADLFGPAASAVFFAGALHAARARTALASAGAATLAIAAVAAVVSTPTTTLALVPAGLAIALLPRGQGRAVVRAAAVVAAIAATAVDPPELARLGGPDGLDASVPVALAIDHLTPWSALVPIAIAAAARAAGQDALARSGLVWLGATGVSCVLVGDAAATAPLFLAAPCGVLCARYLVGPTHATPAAVVVALGVAAVAARDWWSDAALLVAPYLGALEVAGSPLALLAVATAAALAPHPRLRPHRAAIALAAATAFTTLLAAALVPSAIRRSGHRAVTLAAAARGTPVGIVGPSSAAERYAPRIQRLISRHQLAEFLAAGEPRTAIARASDLCHLRSLPRLHVVGGAYGDRRILTNRLLPWEVDDSPLHETFPATAPTGGRSVGALLGDRLELVAADYPARVEAGESFELRLVFRVGAPVARGWKIFLHFEGRSRFLGDHGAEDHGCPMYTWRAGDLVVDRARVRAGTRATPAGTYRIYAGLFRGSRGAWENMPVTRGRRDGSDRVPIGEIEVR